jgi:hypothetical protein
MRFKNVGTLSFLAESAFAVKQVGTETLRQGAILLGLESIWAWPEIKRSSFVGSALLAKFSKSGATAATPLHFSHPLLDEVLLCQLLNAKLDLKNDLIPLTVLVRKSWFKVG